ncbi:MAG: prepilin-type N-terminal cleavage/methylation domain-containing protein [Pseudomonadota bacterium]
MASADLRRTRGLTLVEVLVTVVLTSIMVVGVYMIYSKSVLAFRVENQVMTMQDRLRFGLEHLKRDIRRAGFLATPNSMVDSNICPAPAFHLRAVTITGADGDVAEDGENDNISPSSITLFGDFFSGQVYRTTGVNGNLVYLEASAANFPTNELEFQRIFCGASCNAPNRYLRIVTRDQFEVMLQITGVEFDNAVPSNLSARPYIELNQTVPRVGGGNLCGITGLGEGLEVNVAGFVRYRIAFDTRPNAPTDTGSSGGNPLKTDLIREELDVDGATEMAGTQLVVADYAVDLQFYDFGFDTSGAATLPQMAYFPLVTDVLSGANAGVLNTSANATPQTLRALTLKLTLRADAEDPSHPFDPRAGPYTPIDSYEILPDLQGSCRTLSLACKVGLTSLLARNLNAGGL